MKIPFFGLDAKDCGGIALVCIVTIALVNRLPSVGPLPAGKKILGTV